MKTEDFKRRRDKIEGWDVDISTYRIGESCYCHVDNVSPGATVSRGEGKTPAEAEKVAVEKARERLKQTKKVAR